MSIAFLPMTLLLFFVMIVPIFVGVYVYKDASRRSMNAALWTVLSLFAPGFVGFIIYLIVRSDYADAYCPTCSKPIQETFVVCPHCGVPIPEEQKNHMSVLTKKGKRSGIPLAVLIIVPVVLCITLIIATSFFSVHTGSSSPTHTIEADPFLKE